VVVARPRLDRATGERVGRLTAVSRDTGAKRELLRRDTTVQPLGAIGGFSADERTVVLSDRLGGGVAFTFVLVALDGSGATTLRAPAARPGMEQDVHLWLRGGSAEADDP
jgi:hypothetical protein